MRALRRFAVLCLVLMVVGFAASADAVTLRVRGGSELDLVAFERPSEVVLRGEISDEVGASVGRVSIRIEALGPDGKTMPLDPPRSCAEDARTPARHERTAYVVTTGERGDFCVVTGGRFAGAKFKASFAGNNHFEGSEAQASPVPENEQRADTSLRFESAPTTLDLDKESHILTVSVRISRLDAARLLLDSSKREKLSLLLSDERGTKLGEALTGGDGKARFTIKSRDLAPPGNGELKLEFAGDKQLAAAKTSIAITRTATAVLDVPESVTGDPDGGLAIDLEVGSSHGPVDGGIVEALLGNDAVGAGRVENGHVKLVVTFPGGAAGSIPISLRYVSSSPFWQAGPPSTVNIRVAGPSPIRQAVLGIVGLALAGWIVAKWRRAPKSEKSDSLLPPPPSGRPEILVLDRPSGLKGWRGLVADAHDGYPIAGADLRILVPSFDGKGELASATTDNEGRFTLDLADAPREARLVVEGSLHATYEQPLPAPSVLRVALVTRRRALLDRLVRWARVRGSPFDSSKEPTPGHVRRVAARTGAGSIETWAEDVEHAAFGPTDVTREIEQGIVSAEPTGFVQPQGAADLVAGRGEPRDLGARIVHSPRQGDSRPSD